MSNDKLFEAFQFHDVTDFAFVRDYILSVRFDDGAERAIDFEPILLGPLFGPLRDLHLFRQVRVDRDLGTLVWPNGADIDPNVLHDWPQHADAIIQRRQLRFATEPAMPSNGPSMPASMTPGAADQETLAYIEERGQRDSRERFDHVLLKVAEADLEPYEADRLPE